MDAALFNAVGMDVALPLYCGYGRYCPFTAAIMDAAFYTAVRVNAASFSPAVGGRCPFLLMLTLALYTAVSVYAAYIHRLGRVLTLFIL